MSRCEILIGRVSKIECRGSRYPGRCIVRVCALLAGLLLVAPAVAEEPALPWGPTPSAAAAYARAAAITALGRALFFDPALSASGRMACATCHDPAHGFSAPNASSVQLGGPDLRRPGIRAVPSLMYGQSVPAFTEHFFESEDEGDESVDQGPTGGRDWDGRVDRARDQATLPLLDKNEMANARSRNRRCGGGPGAVRGGGRTSVWTGCVRRSGAERSRR